MAEPIEVERVVAEPVAVQTAPAAVEQPVAVVEEAPAAVAVAVAAPTQAPVPTPAPAPAPVADLKELLGSAGLTLAATDPEKLRAAREAAEQVAPPVRVPRTRKPLPPQADEPLIQVDTRQ